MTATDTRTTNQGYEQPVPTNLISDDVIRLATALSRIDGDVFAVLAAIASKAPLVHDHEIAQITGLQALLDALAPIDHKHWLSNLEDVDVSGAVVGQVIGLVGAVWQPVSITADQFGAYTTGQIDTALAPLQAHEASTENPHNVTKAQLGLGNVDNTADTAKPVSTTQQAAFDKRMQVRQSATALATGQALTVSNRGTCYTAAFSATAWTVTLPDPTTLEDGWHVTFEGTGLAHWGTNGSNATVVAHSAKNIEYRGYSDPTFHMLGRGEVFTFTWLKTEDRWVAECRVQPSRSFSHRQHHAAGYHVMPTSWTAISFSVAVAGDASSYLNISGGVRVPVAGVYSHKVRVPVWGNGVNGFAYINGTNENNILDVEQGYDHAYVFTTSYYHLQFCVPLARNTNGALGCSYTSGTSPIAYNGGSATTQYVELISR